MPINFFKQACKTQSDKTTFGLCDDPPPAKDPAYIDENNPSEWIATINNPTNIRVDFYAIDHCVKILKPNNKDEESRCDGLLHHTNDLTFVELKDRASSGWLTKGRGQLTTTIAVFSAHYDITVFNKVEAYVANKQRPLANTSMSNEIQKFKDDTGLTLRVQATISI